MCHRADHREPESVDAESVAAVARLRAELRRAEREIRNLRRENEVLREAAAPLIHGAPARERFAFIDARRGRFSVKLVCSVLVTDRGSYYAWVRAGHKRREREYDDRRLTALILEVHTAHPAYGVPRVTRELQRQGVPVGRRIVTRLMQQNGISGITRRRRGAGYWPVMRSCTPIADRNTTRRLIRSRCDGWGSEPYRLVSRRRRR